MDEVWRPIPGYEGLYYASNWGRIKSFNRCAKGRLLKPGRITIYGHVTVALGRQNSQLVHALVMLAFVGPRPCGSDILHIDGNASNNRLCNLKYGTRSENNRDITRHGRRKVDKEGVQKIRSGEMKFKKAADKYSIGQTQFYNIKNRRHYAEI